MNNSFTDYDREYVMMHCAVKRLVDYVYEESFFIDKEVIKDDETYSKLFEKIYAIFKRNNILSYYNEAMKLYIAMCVVNNDDIDINTLVEGLMYLESDMKMKKHQIPDVDLENIKNEYGQKIKVLSLVN